MLKRIIDILMSLATLISFSPLLIVISLIILSQKDGPIIFCQQRIGYHNKLYTLYKFRTMIHRNMENIDQINEPVIKDAFDHRITPIGRILRHTSLDELPQLFNVFAGNMSLVGPRPLLPEQLSAVPQKFYGRFSVRPGITGWAQINGRQSLDWLEKLKADIWYVNNRKIYLDFLIIIKTIKIVLRPADIYVNNNRGWRDYL